MSIYGKYILPHLLNWTMRGKKLEHYRSNTVSHVSGTGLEIGFGAGNNIPFYKNIDKLYALDPNEGQYKLAQKKIFSATFTIKHILASAEHIPLPDNSLDFVVSTWTLCSIPNPEQAMKEVFRVLRSGGIFSCVEHGLSPCTHIAKIQNILTPISKRCAGGCNLNRDIKTLITNAGFAIRESNTFTEHLKPLAIMYTFVAVANK